MSDEMTASMRASMSLDGDADKLRSFYARWAETYDVDVSSNSYGIPSSLLDTLCKAIALVEPDSSLADPQTPILDLGCGTGQMGLALAQFGYEVIDGVDLSHEMLELAKKTGAYRRLEGGIDLAQAPPEHLRASADIATVAGVFTVGHVPPEALRTASAFVRPGGLLVLSTRKEYQHSVDFEAVANSLIEEGVIRLVVHQADLPYTMDSTGDYWAYQIPG